MTKLFFNRSDKAGDALKTIPVLLALKTHYPEMEIKVMVSDANASLFETIPFLSITRELRELDNDWDHYFDLRFDHPESKFKGDVINQCESQNIASLIENTLNVRLPWKDFQQYPFFTNEDYAFCENLLIGDILLCPFAGNSNRTQQLAKWDFIIRTMPKKYTFSVVGAPGNTNQMEYLKNKYPSRIRSLITLPNFRSLGPVIRKAKFTIAVDSGPAHFAILLGCPVLVIMSGGDQKRWYSNMTHTNQKVLRRGLLGRQVEWLRIFYHLKKMENSSLQ